MRSNRELMELRAARANSFRPAQGLKSCDVCENSNVRKFPLTTSPDEAEKRELNVVIVGGRDAGKTEVLHRFKGDSEEFLPTSISGFSHLHRTFFVGNHVIDALLWDRQKPEFSTGAGLPETYSLFFKDSIAALLVYDVTNALSMRYIPDYLRLIRQHNRSENYVIMLVGNKIDRDNHRVVTTSWGLKFADDNELLFEEISATKGTNSEDAFENLITEIANRTIQKKQRIQMGTGSSTEARPENLSRTSSGTSTEARAGSICDSSAEERARAENSHGTNPEARAENRCAASTETRTQNRRRENPEARAENNRASSTDAQVENDRRTNTEAWAENSCASSTEARDENSRRTNTEAIAENRRTSSIEVIAENSSGTTTGTQARVETTGETNIEARARFGNFPGTKPESIERAKYILRVCTEAGARARAENSRGTNTNAKVENIGRTSTQTNPKEQQKPKCKCHCTIL